MSLDNSYGLFNLAVQRVGVFQHVKKLKIVNLKQHVDDLSGEVWVHPLYQQEEKISHHMWLSKIFA